LYFWIIQKVEPMKMDEILLIMVVSNFYKNLGDKIKQYEIDKISIITGKKINYFNY